MLDCNCASVPRILQIFIYVVINTTLEFEKIELDNNL